MNIPIHFPQVLEFFLFVDAIGASGLGDLQDVFAAHGAGVPHRAMGAALLESSHVESVDACVGVAFGRPDIFDAAVESASSVFVFGLQQAGLVVGGMCAAAASAEFLFGGFDFVDPVGVPVVVSCVSMMYFLLIS